MRTEFLSYGVNLDQVRQGVWYCVPGERGDMSCEGGSGAREAPAGAPMRPRSKAQTIEGANARGCQRSRAPTLEGSRVAEKRTIYVRFSATPDRLGSATEPD